MNEIKAYFDGSAKPNPGQMRIGGLIVHPNGDVLYKYSIDKGWGTNNEAEYLSLLHLLENLIDIKAASVIIYGDSQLVVNQVNGTWKANDPRMEAFKIKALGYLSRIKNHELHHVNRNKNARADGLTR